MASSLQTFKRHLVDASTQDKYAFTRNSRFRVRISWPNGEPKTITDNNPFVSELANDIDYYVKSVNIPNFKIGGRSLELDDLTDTDAVPGFSDLIIQNSLLLPQEMNFSIEFYDTEISFIDSYIEPWARYILSPKGDLNQSQNSASNNKLNSDRTQIQKTVNIPKATFEIDILSKAEAERVLRTYIIEGCFPSIIDNPELTHENSEFIIRKIEFSFSKLSIKRGKIK